MNEFELLIGVLFKVVDEEIKVRKIVFSDDVTSSWRINVGQKLNILLQKWFQELELELRKLR